MGTRMHAEFTCQQDSPRAVTGLGTLYPKLYIIVQYWNNCRTNETAATKQKQCEHPRHLRARQPNYS